MASLSLELFTTGQGISPIQVKGENMNHLVTAYQGSPQKKKSSGRSHKNLNLAREQRNNMFTVACDIKIKDFFIKTQQSI